MAKFKTGKIEKSNTLKRFVGDDIVAAVLYDGHHVGHGGAYISGAVNGQLVKDKNDKPLPLKQIGILR